MTYDYNSSRKKLILPEYGRNIQKMVNHIKTIEDREERNKAAQTVIGVMGNLNPHLRDVNDFKHKLWDHLAIIADFDLDRRFSRLFHRQGLWPPQAGASAESRKNA